MASVPEASTATCVCVCVTYMDVIFLLWEKWLPLFSQSSNWGSHKSPKGPSRLSEFHPSDPRVEDSFPFCSSRSHLDGRVPRSNSYLFFLVVCVCVNPGESGHTFERRIAPQECSFVWTPCVSSPPSLLLARRWIPGFIHRNSEVIESLDDTLLCKSSSGRFGVQQDLLPKRWPPPPPLSLFSPSDAETMGLNWGGHRSGTSRRYRPANNPKS